MSLKIEYLPPSELTEDESNVKIHSKEQIEQIKSSINKFGFNDPIGVWGKENKVVEGNGRLQAALQLKLDSVPIIRLDELSPKQRDAYAIVHNKLTMNTDFDFSKLSKELGELSTDFDMMDFGFSNFEIAFEHDLQAQLKKKQEEKPASTTELEKDSPEETSKVVEIACGNIEEIEWLKKCFIRIN